MPEENPPGLYGYLSVRESANRKIFRPLSFRKPPNITSILASRSLPHSFPWKCKFRVTDIVSQTGDISHRRRGREVDVRVRKDRGYTVNISRTNFSISSPMSSSNLDDDKVDPVHAIRKIHPPRKTEIRYGTSTTEQAKEA